MANSINQVNFRQIEQGIIGPYQSHIVKVSDESHKKNIELENRFVEMADAAYLAPGDNCTDQTALLSKYYEEGYDINILAHNGECTGRNVGDLVGFVARKGNEVIVSIHGTVTNDHWKTNFNVKGAKVNFAPGVIHGVIHEGSYKIAHEISEQIESFVSKDNIKITFIGHSLGGAIAKAVALETVPKLRKNSEIKVRTYGAFKNFDKEMANHYNKKIPDTIEYVQPHDLIPYAFSPIYKGVGKKKTLFGLHIPHLLGGYQQSIKKNKIFSFNLKSILNDSFQYVKKIFPEFKFKAKSKNASLALEK